jgi:hypothetical protein
MLSVACCHEPAPLLTSQAEEPVRPVLSPRRLTVSFAADSRQKRGQGSSRRDNERALGIPTYSRITFRAGAVSVR